MSKLTTHPPASRAIPAPRIPQNSYGASIAQTARQFASVSSKDSLLPKTGKSKCAAAVSMIFTKATNQAIMPGTEPRHVLSTSLLCNSLLHDARFMEVSMSEAVPGDIVIESGRHEAAGFAGIVADHGRIVSNGSQGVQNNSSLAEFQRHHLPIAVFRYIGIQKPWGITLANTGYDSNEPRIPAGQPGGGQWTTGMAPSTVVLSGGNNRTQAAGTNVSRSNNDNSLKAKPAAINNDNGTKLKTPGQAAKETARAFLSSLITGLRGLLFPSEPDGESSKPKNIFQLGKELDEPPDDIDMTTPKGLGHAMAAGAGIAAGEAVSEGAAGSAGEGSGANTQEGALPDAGGPGASEALKYEPNPKHPPAGTVAPGESHIAPQPTNPQEALNTSVPYKANSSGRVAVDPATGEFVVFQQHSPGKYHGYAVTWRQLTQAQKNALVNSGQVTVSGKIK
jgi:hypothetical protein